MDSNKDKTIRDRTGSYDHLTRKQEKAARESSLHHSHAALDTVEAIKEDFSVPSESVDRRRIDINESNPDAKQNIKAIESEKGLRTPSQTLTTILQPKHVAEARRKVYNTVMKNMARAEEVLAGKRKWSNQQVTLFNKLLNKVVPDLHHSVSDVNVAVTGNVNELSVEDLMKIALATPPEVFDGEYEPIDNEVLDEVSPPPEPEPENYDPLHALSGSQDDYDPIDDEPEPPSRPIKY